MAPEQITGSRDVDGRADIYALGVVGYEILTGSRPFAAVRPQLEVGAQITTVPTPLARKRPDIPLAVSDAIDRALATDPNARFQTAAEFRDALLSGIAGAPARSRRMRTAIIGAVVAVAAVVLAVVFWPRSTVAIANPRNSFIVFPFRSRLNDPAWTWLENAAPDLIGLSLSHWQDLTVFGRRAHGIAAAARANRKRRALDFDAGAEDRASSARREH
jgi:serine/threonine-protein kinase